MANDVRTHLIGLLLGAEEDWPRAFESILSLVGPVEADGETHSITSERVRIHPFDLTDPVRHGLVIDAAHGNCGKDERREAEVNEEIAERLAHGEQGITGVMMESFLVGGHQKPAPLDQLVYGQSVTDACVPWDRTNELLHTLADAVTARRSAK